MFSLPHALSPLQNKVILKYFLFLLSFFPRLFTTVSFSVSVLVILLLSKKKTHKKHLRLSITQTEMHIQKKTLFFFCSVRDGLLLTARAARVFFFRFSFSLFTFSMS